VAPRTVCCVETTSTTENLRIRADDVLATLVGSSSGGACVAFRDGQWEAVRSLVADRARALVVQRTGWGKSAVYFVATALLRARGAGPTLLISPLLALMRDQVSAARRAGVRALEMNSANASEWGDVTAAVAADDVDLLLISPERLTNPRFAEELLPTLLSRCGLLVVDEAHCISDWGHDFRPDYRRIRDLLTELPPGTPVLATTATANSRVVQDVEEQLGAGGVPVLTVRGPLARDSLRLGVLRLPGATDRLAWLSAHLGSLSGSGIIYTLTVSAAEDTAALLRDAGHHVLAYTGRTDDSDRRSAEEALRRNEIKALVATSALGMGFDKPDLGFVVHLGAPSSPVAYYQQVGRAGRAVERADVLLLPGAEDEEIWRYFASASMPRQQDADAVLAALKESPRAMSTAALETVADVRRTRLELLLKVLAVEGAVERVGGGWRATGTPWSYDAERYGRVQEARRAEQDAMRAYERGETCRMAFLQHSLDDASARPCGRCDVCAGPWYPKDVPDAARSAAGAQLERAGVEIAPRVQWPTGMDRLGVPVKGRIPAGEQLETGRALARLTDLGWGQRLRELLSPAVPDGPVSPEIVRACVNVLAEWAWEQRPAAVTWVPSRRRPHLVGSVAAELARLGRLADLGPLEPRHGGPSGEAGGNSAFRLAGVWERFAVGSETALRLRDLQGAPVLLVDELVDSRWTVTVAGRELRRAGAGPILPFALALAG
jgi:ATP-dependent DNA helicase RecQ